MLWLTLAAGCAIVAAIYAVLWPRPKAGMSRATWRALLLRWGHSAVWVLLAVSFLMRASDTIGVAAQANLIAILGGLLYLTFLVTLVIERRR